VQDELKAYCVSLGNVECCCALGVRFGCVGVNVNGVVRVVLWVTVDEVEKFLGGW